MKIISLEIIPGLSLLFPFLLGPNCIGAAAYVDSKANLETVNITQVNISERCR